MSHEHHHAFRFYANGTEFFPHAGTRLNFVNRGIDTLTLKSLPADTLAGGDAITVTYAHTAGDEQTTVFSGTVEQITESTEGGPANSWQDAVVSSPWSKFDRLIYQQHWKNYSTDQWVWSSNLVLNQDRNGNSIGFKTQLNDIFTFLKTRCNVTATALAGGQTLPFDEVRDLTCAQAINRVLRWFPKKTVRLDYSGGTPNLELADPSAASWAASIDKSSIVRTYCAHPITGVCLETITTGDDNGVAYRSVGNQNYPATIDPSDVDVLHASIQLAGASSSNAYESAKFRCETPAPQSNVWWWQKHGRLKKYSSVAEMSQHVSVVSYDSDMPDGCDKITSATAEELQKYGLKAGVAKFTAHVKIGTDGDDDIEEDVILQMQFTATNAVNDKTYTRATGSSYTSGETIPDNLAQAIYEDRSGALLHLECVARLGGTFPQVGETYQGLILQSFEVDPYELTVECRFGQPDHLSPDDMAGLMTGFRNRIRSTSCWERDSGKRGGGDDEDVPDPVDPISATEFAPGTKSKTTIKASSGSGGSIELDSTQVESGNKIGVHTLTVIMDEEEVYSGQIMSAEDITLDLTSGGGTEGEDQEVITGIDSVELVTEESTPKLKINYKKKTVKVVSNDGSDTTDSVSLTLAKTDVVKESSYSTQTHKFENTLSGVVVFDDGDPTGESPAEVFEATPHSREVVY